MITEKDKITKYLNELSGCMFRLKKYSITIQRVADILRESNRIFICGNGGSSTTASHMVNDFIKMCGLNATCLSDSVSTLMAYANDECYENIFKRQLEILAKKGDTLIVLSGSGNSKNIINALEYANSIEMKTIAFVGMDGGVVKKHYNPDALVHIETDMQHSEDVHMILGHLLAVILKFGK